jgi:hypothetical protein
MSAVLAADFSPKGLDLDDANKIVILRRTATRHRELS